MIHGTVTGRLGKDVETKQGQKGGAFASFSVASTRYEGKEKGQVTTWVNVVVFGQQAEFLGKYARKGAHINCVGDINIETYESKDGSRTSLKMTAEKVELVNNKADGGDHQTESKPVARAVVPAKNAEPIDDSDIPF